MANALRKSIIDDVGYAKLRQKTLDFLTGLRLHEKLLNDAKTEERTIITTLKQAAIKNVTN